METIIEQMIPIQRQLHETWIKLMDLLYKEKGIEIGD